jgi:hypothetical protein
VTHRSGSLCAPVGRFPAAGHGAVGADAASRMRVFRLRAMSALPGPHHGMSGRCSARGALSAGMPEGPVGETGRASPLAGAADHRPHDAARRWSRRPGRWVVARAVASDTLRIDPSGAPGQQRRSGETRERPCHDRGEGRDVPRRTPRRDWRVPRRAVGSEAPFPLAQQRPMNRPRHVDPDQGSLRPALCPKPPQRIPGCTGIALQGQQGHHALAGRTRTDRQHPRAAVRDQDLADLRDQRVPAWDLPVHRPAIASSPSRPGPYGPCRRCQAIRWPAKGNERSNRRPKRAAPGIEPSWATEAAPFPAPTTCPSQAPGTAGDWQKGRAT